ncbi:hypothetical protein GCM10009800_41400 [Nocardiopsis rhodophaea]
MAVPHGWALFRGTRARAGAADDRAPPTVIVRVKNYQYENSGGVDVLVRAEPGGAVRGGSGPVHGAPDMTIVDVGLPGMGIGPCFALAFLVGGLAQEPWRLVLAR